MEHKYETSPFEIIDKMRFFGGQRAGRELWAAKPKEIQDADITSFNRDLDILQNVLPKWISVEDRLPKNDGKYIVCTVKGSVYCTIFKAYAKGGSFGTDINTHITHWMPLPEPPKEE